MKSHKRVKAKQRRNEITRRRVAMPPIWKLTARTPYLPTVDSRPLGLGHRRTVIRDPLGRYVEL